jgi:hypothetical protein
MILKATNETLELITSTTSQIDVSVSFSDINATTSTPNSQETTVTTAVTSVILSSPVASAQKFVIELSIKNSGTTANTVIIQKKVGATAYQKIKVVLNTHETLIFNKDTGFKVLTNNGVEKKEYSSSSIITSKPYSIFKAGGSSEGAGIIHSLALAIGMPSSWSVGTPGLAGRATNGTNVSDRGCLLVTNATTGANYITALSATANTACTPQLVDFLWVNTGIVVTTTTAQTINSVAFPARDVNLSTAGLGVNIAILVTAGTTNSANISNITMSYTNSDGVAGRAANIAIYPLTAIAGTLIPFQLQGADTGVQSIQTITIGTSLLTGSISLVAYRLYAQVPGFVTNSGGQIESKSGFNIRLPDNVCLLPQYVPTGTGATTLQYFINVEEK